MKERKLLDEMGDWFEASGLRQCATELKTVAEVDPIGKVRSVLSLFADIGLHVKLRSAER